MLNAAQAVVRLQSQMTAAHYMFTEDKEEKITALRQKISPWPPPFCLSLYSVARLPLHVRCVTFIFTRGSTLAGFFTKFPVKSAAVQRWLALLYLPS
ncbi:hypothetical protein BXA22_10400 [Edwardsiella piscicida]|nr:hypothetical protein BXA22_10400 [Edwardsiella piscicida]QBB12764.1 hypothetical protein EVK84_09555 [Edwardsiella piscicida]